MQKSSGILRLLSLREVNDAKGEKYKLERGKFLNIPAPKIITSFNLFQTPSKIALKMVEMAGNLHGKSILEPSAGLGRIIEQIPEDLHKNITAYDINIECVEYLYNNFSKVNKLKRCDFLSVDSGEYEIIIMNPPFKQGQDIKHILHAVKKLKSGGVLIALCYDGIRQNNILKPICDYWEVLPENSFKESGTNASVSILRITKEVI